MPPQPRNSWTSYMKAFPAGKILPPPSAMPSSASSSQTPTPFSRSRFIGRHFNSMPGRRSPRRSSPFLPQSSRHERIHLTLKKEATKPAAGNFLQQQACFDKFIEVFNNERPHEALDMKCPAEVYQPSPRPYTGLPDIDYPFHDKIIVVTNCGRICLGQKKINFSTVFAGQAVGIKEVHDDIWLVSFMDYDLGYFDLET